MIPFCGCIILKMLKLGKRIHNKITYLFPLIFGHTLMFNKFIVRWKLFITLIAPIKGFADWYMMVEFYPIWKLFFTFVVETSDFHVLTLKLFQHIIDLERKSSYNICRVNLMEIFTYSKVSNIEYQKRKENTKSPWYVQEKSVLQFHSLQAPLCKMNIWVCFDP